MTGSTISPKLKALLVFSVVVAAFGGWRLMTQEEVAVESGFEPNAEIPLVTDEAVEADLRVPDVTGPISRNPFQRTASSTPPTSNPEESSGGSSSSSSTTATPTTIGDSSGGTASESTPSSVPVPVFPDPDLVDQEPDGDGRRGAGDDTSFEG